MSDALPAAAARGGMSDALLAVGFFFFLWDRTEPGARFGRWVRFTAAEDSGGRAIR